MSKQAIVVYLLILFNCCSSCKGQKVFGENLLRLDKTISLPSVKGRIDHMDINLADQIVYVAALGNNTLEAIDIQKGTVIHTIKNLDEPQGVCYVPRRHEIFVANGGNGDCHFYNARNYEKLATIKLGSDADDVRYDEASNKIFVGYGSGAIAIIDADTHQQTGDVKLPGHPESFQIDNKLHLLFVNVPDSRMVASIDANQAKLVSKWQRDSPTANFPMAIDSSQHLVYIGYRHPAKLVVMDGKTGKDIRIQDMAGDADDMYFDSKTNNVFVSGGDGYISIFHQEKGAGTQIANIESVKGARTSLLVPSLRYFIVAARANAGNAASLLLYKVLPEK